MAQASTLSAKDNALPTATQLTTLDPSAGHVTTINTYAVTPERMPLISRLLFTLSAIGLSVGAHVADWSPSHLFNDRWPPHAKFHTGQTLSMSVLLSAFTIFFAWRRTLDRREAVLATTGFAAAYWVTQATAILYPNTGFYDPEFITARSFTLGLPVQVYFEFGFLSVIALAAWLATWKSARWSN